MRIARPFGLCPIPRSPMTLPEARRRECPSDHKASRRHGTVLPRASGSCVPLVFVDSSRTGERAAGLLGRPADDWRPGRGGSGNRRDFLTGSSVTWS